MAVGGEFRRCGDGHCPPAPLEEDGRSTHRSLGVVILQPACCVCCAAGVRAWHSAGILPGPTTVRRMRPSSGTLRRFAGKEKAPSASSTTQGMVHPDTKINYLIPVDVANADDEELWNYSINLNTLVENLRSQAPGATHYVVFDACRNELNLTRKGQKALTEKGFVPLAFTPGVMIAYSTAPGKTATDTGSNGGPYAQALAEELVKPGVEAMTMFRRVALRVNREIGQDPWMSASTLPEVYFAGAPPASNPIVPPPAGAWSEVEHAWAAAKDTTSIAALEAFIRRFGDTYYSELAKARLEEIKRSRAANLTPPSEYPDLATTDCQASRATDVMIRACSDII